MSTFLITGATGGIGGAVARALHRRGDDLLLAGRDAARMAALVAELPGARPLLGDLAKLAELSGSTDLADSRELVDPNGSNGSHASSGLADLVAGVDRLDGLVHCAGTVWLGTVAETPWRVWRDILMVNLAAPAELTRVLLPALRAAGGQVVFVNSGSGQRANPGWSSYAASKFGLRALADALRAEEASNGVRVSTVYPGRTATEMQRRVRAAEGGEYDPDDYLSAQAVATVVLAALDAPQGAEITELTIRPAG